MIVKAWAKTNLHLQILPKRQDNLHGLVSLMQRLDSLYDELDIELCPSSQASINVEGIASPNSLTKAFWLWTKAYEIPLEANIRIKKRIPSPAGLGGPSSDAASLLLYLNRSMSHSSLEELVKLGFLVGCDVPFFLYETKAAVVTGAGENVMSIEAVDLRGKIVYPSWEKKSTKDAYEMVDKLPRKPLLPISAVLEDYYSKGFESWRLFNDFSSLYPEKEEKYPRAILNGSGPSLIVLDKNLNLL